MVSLLSELANWAFKCLRIIKNFKPTHLQAEELELILNDQKTGRLPMPADILVGIYSLLFTARDVSHTVLHL